MISASDYEINELRQVSVRYDQASETYFCFYRRMDDVTINLTLSYSLKEQRWAVESNEFRSTTEKPLNDVVEDLQLPFEEQIRHVIRYLDQHFSESNFADGDRSASVSSGRLLLLDGEIREKTLKNRAFLDRMSRSNDVFVTFDVVAFFLFQGFDPLAWLRRLKNMRRYASQQLLHQSSPKGSFLSVHH